MFSPVPVPPSVFSVCGRGQQSTNQKEARMSRERDKLTNYFLFMRYDFTFVFARKVLSICKMWSQHTMACLSALLLL